MKHTIVAALTGCMAVKGSAMAQEKKIKRSDLPAAVEKTVAAQARERLSADSARRRKKARRLMKCT
jgi:uncharacterized OsmC-like protein